MAILSLPDGFLQEMFMLQEEVDYLGSDAPESVRLPLKNQVESRLSILRGNTAGLFARLDTAQEVPQMEVSAASQKAGQSNQQRKQSCFHPADATDRTPKKSTESIRTRFTMHNTPIKRLASFVNSCVAKWCFADQRPSPH